MKVYPPEKTKSTYLYGDGQPSAWERYAVRALSEKFLAHAQRVKREGRDDTYYLKCADIARRLETGLPVGRDRRKRKSARGADGRADV